MGRYFALVLVAVLLAISLRQERERLDTGVPSWDLLPPAADAKRVVASKKLPGIYPVGSQIKDEKALGGFGPCDNFPRDLGDQDWGTPGEIAIVAFTDEPVAYFRHRGFAVRVINRTLNLASFAACDSALHLVREAQDTHGAWRAIESLPTTYCGNSYHRVFLRPGQYWQFPAREYAGSMKTKLRFRLDPGDDLPSIYSNEFDGQVAAVQFASD